MLVLYRAGRESFNVGEDIEIKVLKILDNQVKIGIKAPEGLLIWRTEKGPRGVILRKKENDIRDQQSDFSWKCGERT